MSMCHHVFSDLDQGGSVLIENWVNITIVMTKNLV